MNLSQALLLALKDRGARALFGLPGDYVLDFFAEVEQAGTLPLYTLSHEPGVAFAADGAARYGDGSGAPSLGVAVTTYGAGAMNMLNGAAGAWAEQSPVVFISGAPGVAEWNGGLLLHHRIKSPDSQLNAYREVTCAQLRLDDPTAAPKRLAQVLDACVHQSRPVYIEVPRDMVAVPTTAVAPLAPAAFSAAALETAVGRIVERLGAAGTPAILAGVEVRRFGLEDRVAEIARALDCPLLSTFMGKGMFSRHGDVHRGAYLGLAGDPMLRRCVEEADCLVLLGVIPCDTNLGVSYRRIDLQRTIRISNGEICMDDGMTIAIPLDAFCTALAQALEMRRRPAVATAPPPLPAPTEPGTQAIRADDIAPVIAAQLARQGPTPVAVDVGDCLFMAMALRETPVLASGYYATMGFGVPVAIGAQAVSGHRPLVITGDGGFNMTGWELLNCQRFGWGPVVVVLNNHSWEMLRMFQPQAGYTRLGNVAFAELAGPLGGRGEQVRTPAQLAGALQRAEAHPECFYLIEVLLADGDVTRTLRHFADALKRNAGPAPARLEQAP